MADFSNTFLRATLPGGDHVTRWLDGIFSEKIPTRQPKQFKVINPGNPCCVHKSFKDPTTEIWKCKCGYEWQEGEPEDSWELMFGDDTNEARDRGRIKVNKR